MSIMSITARANPVSIYPLLIYTLSYGIATVDFSWRRRAFPHPEELDVMLARVVVEAAMSIKTIMVCTILLGVFGLFMFAGSGALPVGLFREEFHKTVLTVVMLAGLVQLIVFFKLSLALLKGRDVHETLQKERDTLRFGFKYVCDQKVADKALAELALAFHNAAEEEGKIAAWVAKGDASADALESTHATTLDRKAAFWVMHAVVQTLGRGIKARKSYKNYLPGSQKKKMAAA